jgi:transcriptional regulator with XRE-family HTH domain
MGKKRSKRPMAETLAGSIKARIKNLELSAYRVARMSGVNAVVIQRFLNGERDLKLETAERLCQALELVLVQRPYSTLADDLMRERHAEDRQ